MKRKLYYTISFEFDDCDTKNGNKAISVYSIENNELKNFCDIECQNEDNSETEIQSYLDDNGFGDESFELILL